MIADHLLNLIELSLNKLTVVDVAPRKLSYPTRGKKFVRLSATSVEMNRGDHDVRVLVRFRVTCSIRTRNVPVQREFGPYAELADIAERTFFHIIQDRSLLGSIYTVFARPLSVYENFSSHSLGLEAQEVYPDFYGSNDKPNAMNERNVAGLVIQQEFSSPVIAVPINCYDPGILSQELFQSRYPIE